MRTAYVARNIDSVWDSVPRAKAEKIVCAPEAEAVGTSSSPCLRMSKTQTLVVGSFGKIHKSELFDKGCERVTFTGKLTGSDRIWLEVAREKLQQIISNYTSIIYPFTQTHRNPHQPKPTRPTRTIHPVIWFQHWGAMRTTDFSTFVFGVRKESEELCSTLGSCGDWRSAHFPSEAVLF